MFKEQQFRSNLCISGKAKRDHDGRVYMDYRLMYRTYVIDSEQKDLEVGFNEDEKTRIKSTRVALPDKGYEELQEKRIPKEQAASEYLRYDSVTKMVRVAVLPNEKYYQANYLNVEHEVEEYGNDHWINFSYRSSKPTDGLSMTFDCDDDLIVKEAVPYGPINSFDIKISDDKRNISVICSKWMDPGYGVNILIAKRSEVVPAAVESPSSETGETELQPAQKQEPA